MRRTRTKSVELKLAVTLRFSSAVTEPQVRDFIKACLALAPLSSEEWMHHIAAVHQPSATRVYVLQRTTFNQEPGTKEQPR